MLHLIVHLQGAGVLLGSDFIAQIVHEIVHVGHFIDHLGAVLQLQKDLVLTQDQLGGLLLQDGLPHVGIGGGGGFLAGAHQHADGHQQHDEEHNIEADAAAASLLLVQALCHSFLLPERSRRVCRIIPRNRPRA